MSADDIVIRDINGNEIDAKPIGPPHVYEISGATIEWRGQVMRLAPADAAELGLQLLQWAVSGLWPTMLQRHVAHSGLNTMQEVIGSLMDGQP